MGKLCWYTVSPILRQILILLMQDAMFKPFRLVGGTALSLQIGHRMSVDIDLFTDATYDSIDFEKINSRLRNLFSYVTVPYSKLVSMGRMYDIGYNETDCVKLDLFYTDTFIQPALNVEKICMATVEEIIAMKIDIVQRGGRKKDFWDLHELLDKYSPMQMIELHKERYPYAHDAKLITNNFTVFNSADDDFDPICLNGKHWEIIKLEIIRAVSNTHQ